jgi:hypothetical protein
MLVQIKLTNSLVFASLFTLTLIFSSFVSNYASATYNFGAAGDWGCTSNTGATVSTLKGQSPERVLGVGDYSYTSTPTCWLDKISSIKSITRIAFGNHEDDSSEGFSQYLSAFGLSKTYYSVNLNVGLPDATKVIFMDSDHSSYSSGSDQYNFVVSELKKTGFKWKIVVDHKQFYTSPNTCGAGSCSNTASDPTNLRNIYQRLFEQYGVDLVVNGHVHNYQRTYPIRYDSGSPSTPIVTDTAGTDYTDPPGQIFVIVGTGGVNFHALSGKASWVRYQQDAKFGGLDIRVEDSGNTLSGRYYTNDGIKRDTFKIHKGTTTLSATYSYGPSLTLSGESATATVSGETGSVGISGANTQSPIIGENGGTNGNSGGSTQTPSGENNKNPGQPNGQGNGLNCEHFKQQGPVRCR